MCFLSSDRTQTRSNVVETSKSGSLWSNANEHCRVKEGLKERGYYENSPEMRVIIASLASSVLCVIVETPLDVVNTRLFNQGNVVLKYSSYMN